MMEGRVFTCYSHEDKEFVHLLARQLKMRGVPIWLDEFDIPGGADWDRSIDRALRECSRLLIVLSPGVENSIEARGELQMALRDRKPVVPILYRGNWIPRQLLNIHYLDFSSGNARDESLLRSLIHALGGSREAAIETSVCQPQGPAELDFPRATFAPATGVPLPSGVARPTPEPPGRPLLRRLREEGACILGEVIHYYARPSVAVVELDRVLRQGDVVRIVGATTDLVQYVQSMRVNDQLVAQARPKAEIALQVDDRVRSGDLVCRARPEDAPQRLVGRVLRYYDRIGVAGVILEERLRLGDTIRITGPGVDLSQVVTSLQVNRCPVPEAQKGSEIGLKIDGPVRRGSRVFLCLSPPGVLVGSVVHYYSRAGAALIALAREIQLGDQVHIVGPRTDVCQVVGSIEVEHQRVKRAYPPANVGIGIGQKVRSGDLVYRGNRFRRSEGNQRNQSSENSLPHRAFRGSFPAFWGSRALAVGWLPARCNEFRASLLISRTD